MVLHLGVPKVPDTSVPDYARVDAKKIKNPTLRSIFETAVRNPCTRALTTRPQHNYLARRHFVVRRWIWARMWWSEAKGCGRTSPRLSSRSPEAVTVFSAHHPCDNMRVCRSKERFGNWQWSSQDTRCLPHAKRHGYHAP